MSMGDNWNMHSTIHLLFFIKYFVWIPLEISSYTTCSAPWSRECAFFRPFMHIIRKHFIASWICYRTYTCSGCCFFLSLCLSLHPLPMHGLTILFASMLFGQDDIGYFSHSLHTFAVDVALLNRYCSYCARVFGSKNNCEIPVLTGIYVNTIGMWSL